MKHLRMGNFVKYDIKLSVRSGKKEETVKKCHKMIKEHLLGVSSLKSSSKDDIELS